MGIIGFNYTKISGEKKQVANTPEKGFEVKHNLNIKDLKKVSLDLGSKKSDVLAVKFGFNAVYGEIGTVTLEGEILYTDTSDIINESEKMWSKNKEISSVVRETVQVFAYSKCIVKAIDVSDSLNLPSPIPLPKIVPKKK